MGYVKKPFSAYQAENGCFTFVTEVVSKDTPPGYHPGGVSFTQESPFELLFYARVENVRRRLTGVNRPEYFIVEYRRK